MKLKIISLFLARLLAQYLVVEFVEDLLGIQLEVPCQMKHILTIV